MKIGLIGPYYPAIGGVQIYLTYLAREFLDMGHEVVVFSYTNASPQSYEKVIRAPSPKIPGLRGLSFIVFTALNLSREELDVISAHYALTSGVAALLSGRRYTVTLHGSDLKMGRSICRMVSMRSSAIITVSNWLRDEIEEMGLKVTKVIPGGIDEKLFKDLPPKEHVRGELGLNGRVVLSVGSLTYDKGFDLIPVIAKIVISKVKDAKFLIIGEGPISESILGKIKEFGLDDKVKLLGRKSYHDTIRYYRAADILLHPARHEGYGLVALESLAAGTPVVATNVGGLKDVIENGVNGFLVDINSKTLAERTIELLLKEDLRRKMGERGKEKALKRTWRKVAEEYIEVFRGLI